MVASLAVEGVASVEPLAVGGSGAFVVSVVARFEDGVEVPGRQSWHLA